jgi:sterol desaturase/sphingolipid hydroxylase (fatty acid hydroxylase superfamily)
MVGHDHSVSFISQRCLDGWVTLSFLLMDLAFYYWHLANHRVPFLWRFHNVHHIDPDLDVSTAFGFTLARSHFPASLPLCR